VGTNEYRIVTREGADTLHRWPATESCNLDDTEADRQITEEDGWLMVTGGTAAACRHCFPLPEEVAVG
jgi:hypothetical protein